MIQHRPNRASPWRARVRTPDGREVSRSFRRRIDAEQWAAEQRTDMARGEWVDPAAGDITVTEWLAHVETTKIDIAESTRTTRSILIRTHIEPTLGPWPIGRLTPEMIQRWVTDMAGRRSAATVRKTHAILSEALALAAARGRIIRNPNVAITLPRLERPDHRYLTEPEVWNLAAAIGDRLAPFVLIGAYAGTRPGETIAVRWRDVDLSDRTMHIAGTKTAASRRTVRIPPVLVEALGDHRDRWPSIGTVVARADGRPVDLRNLRKREWQRAVAASVGDPMRPHDLRHTHVALLIAAGAHAKAIADRLGHTSIRTTMDTYGHMLPGVMADVIDRLRGPNAAQTTRPAAVGDVGDRPETQ